MTASHPHLDLALQLADQARQLLAAGLGDYGRAESKDDGSPVTQADRACERALRATLASRVPHHGVWGEEYGRDDAPDKWVLDPIDGTKAFITGSPLFATLIALVEGDEPTIGVIEFPMLGRRWHAAGNQGCLADHAGSRPLTGLVSPVTSLAQANVAMTHPAHDPRAQAVLRSCANVRYGGDAFNFACVAAGSLDVALDEGLKPHDYAALLPVLTAAGAAYADFAGRPPEFGHDLNLAAAGNPKLLDEVLATMHKTQG